MDQPEAGRAGALTEQLALGGCLGWWSVTPQLSANMQTSELSFIVKVEKMDMEQHLKPWVPGGCREAVFMGKQDK